MKLNEFPPRFVQKVTVTEAGCWQWTAKSMSFCIQYQQHRPHIFAYELAKGEIPDGFDLVAQCGNERCVRPGLRHRVPVEPVKNPVRMMSRVHGDRTFQGAKTECIRGHPFTPANTAIWRQHNHPGIRRVCKECRRLRAAGEI